MRFPARWMCACGRVGVHSIRDGRGRCKFNWRVNPRWRTRVAPKIRRLWSEGTSMAQLSRYYGRGLVEDSIRQKV